jgi:hypothetical protein
LLVYKAWHAAFNEKKSAATAHKGAPRSSIIHI